MADAHGMSVQALGFWLVGRGRQLFGDDIDRGAWEELTTALAAASGQPQEALKATTLKSFEGILWGHLPKIGPARWILPVVKTGTFRSGYGVQFCPACLLTDPSPYFRLTWRLAFVVACPEHGCFLHDRCPSCTSPVAPHRWRTGRLRPVGTSGLVSCERCELNRCTLAKQLPAPSDVLRTQATFVQALEEGGGYIDGEPVAAMSYFSGLAMLWSLLDDARQSRTVWGCLQKDIPLAERAVTGRYGSFESTSIERRAGLLRGAGEIVLGGFSDFIQRLADAGSNSGVLLRYSSVARQRAPWWYERPVKELLDRSSYVPAAEEIECAVRYLLRIAPGKAVRARQVCALLGMATGSSRRVSDVVRCVVEFAFRRAA